MSLAARNQRAAAGKVLAGISARRAKIEVTDHLKDAGSAVSIIVADHMQYVYSRSISSSAPPKGAAATTRVSAVSP